jgi:hypothetical protein
MDDGPSYDELAASLRERFPELNEAYDQLLSWHPTAGTHLVFGNVFWPYVQSSLFPKSPRAAATRVFAFIEELANTRREGVQELVTESILDRLLDVPNLMRIAWPFTGRVTRRILLAMAQSSDREDNLPSAVV